MIKVASTNVTNSTVNIDAASTEACSLNVNLINDTTANAASTDANILMPTS